MQASAIDPLKEFHDAIQTPLTRKNYENRLAHFLLRLGTQGNTLQDKANEFVCQAKKDDEEEWATFQINQYLSYQKSRAEKGEISETTLPNYFEPIKLFCIENNLKLNWKKIARRIPHGRRFSTDRIPTIGEIKRILSYPDGRTKPAVLIMLSSGGRVGLFDYLTYGDISPIRNEIGEVIAAKIKIYAGCVEEYQSFITPEAYYSVEEYISFRKDHGENISPESPVLRDLFIPDHLGRGKVDLVRPFKSDLVRHLVDDALKASGIRGRRLEAGKRRHEFQPDHGFRKYFNTVCDHHMKTLYVEFLLGHDTGLKESYNRAQESELLAEYLKVVPELTVSVGGGGGAKISGDAGATVGAATNKTFMTQESRIATLEQNHLALTVGQERVRKTLEEILDILKSKLVGKS